VDYARLESGVAVISPGFVMSVTALLIWQARSRTRSDSRDAFRSERLTQLGSRPDSRSFVHQRLMISNVLAKPLIIGRFRVSTGRLCAFVVSSLALVLLVPSLALPSMVIALGIFRRRVRKGQLRIKRAQDRAMPDLIDMVRLALQSGCTPHTAFVLLEPHVSNALNEHLSTLIDRLRTGSRFTDALEEFRDAIGPSARPLCAALLASERYGLPLSETLERLAIDARLARQREVELASRRLPILLLFPLVTCILPAFALLSIVPLLGGGLSALHW
jgi:tight adherence protein C